MFSTILFLILTMLLIGTLLVVAVLSVTYLVAVLRAKKQTKSGKKLKKAISFFAVLLLLNGSLITASQLMVSTPDILDSEGNQVRNSISELTQLELNGREQWISIRGYDQDKPVLLFLAGGPGGSQMAAVRYELAELEKHFVVVNWDQPGSAKSFDASNTNEMNKEVYIQDGYALTEYLKERFEEDKIYLVGESWGSALGVFLIDQYPESYHGFIGTGQMIDFEETERTCYALALELAKEVQDEKLVATLLKNGEPPYYGEDMVFKSATYLNYLNQHMVKNPAVMNPGYETIRDISASEYGLLDKINYFRGIAVTFNEVYQQLYEVDLREDYTKLDVPVYFLIGRHDLNAPTHLVEAYYEVLEAPDKALIWFEKSGHNPWINENIKFTEEVIRCFAK